MISQTLNTISDRMDLNVTLQSRILTVQIFTKLFNILNGFRVNASLKCTHEIHVNLCKLMHIQSGRESTRSTIGSVEMGADNLGTASGTALRRYSADSRRHSQHRCRCAGCELFPVWRRATGRLRRLIKYRQPVVNKLA